MIYFECLNQSCIFSEKKSHRSRWLHQILIGEIVISYFYELFNRFGFSLLSAIQILRADRSWSPLCALCVLRLLFHLRNFGFHRLYQLRELFFAFLSCLGVHIPRDAFTAHSRREPSFVEVVVYHGDASRAALAYLALVGLKFLLRRGFRGGGVTCPWEAPRFA